MIATSVMRADVFRRAIVVTIMTRMRKLHVISWLLSVYNVGRLSRVCLDGHDSSAVGRQSRVIFGRVEVLNEQPDDARFILGQIDLARIGVLHHISTRHRIVRPT